MRSLYFCFLLFATCALVTTKPQRQGPIAFKAAECQTVSGKRCIFPFVFKGQRYYECTFDNTENGRPWCPYETNDDDTAAPQKWEDCDTDLCPISEDPCVTISGPDTGNTCKFPFTHDHQTYTSCAAWNWADGNYGKPWCSTKTDSFENHVEGGGHYGFCSPDCKPTGPAPTRKF